MEESIFKIAEQINQLHKKAYDTYLPLVDDVCVREVSEKELSHLFDSLLDYACDEKILVLYIIGISIVFKVLIFIIILFVSMSYFKIW